MANKTSNGKCGTQLKRGKVQDFQNKLAHKLQLDLERDLLRSFHDSIYCDIKLTVDSSSSVSTHSCILRTRACRFYKFIYAEFEFFVQNGISVFNIYNASFTHLQSFVENIYTSVHTAKAEDCIIKHLQEIKTSKLSPGTRSAKTPESDLFFTPKCSPSELQKPFASSKLKLQENNVASYYKIVSVDDIPVDEKLEGNKSNEEGEGSLLEKELAEQDELFSSFKTIFSKKTKIKPNSLSLGNSSQPSKKPKPKFNRKFESNVLLYDDHKGKYRLPQWKPNPAVDSRTPRDKYSGLKVCKKNPKPQEKGDSETNLEDPAASLCSSDMEVSTTGGDSGLDNSSICQQETSPKEHTMSETSGVDLTEAAINEDIPNDGTFSTKRSTGSSVSSEDGTWGPNDDLKGKSPPGKDNLNEEEMLRLDEMERNIRDCEIFLYMERQGSVGGDSHRECDRAATPNPSEMSGKEGIYQYAEDNELNNPQGEPGHRLNNDEEENYYNYNLRNSSDAIASRENLNDVNSTNEEDLNANEFPKQGASGDLILNSNVEYFSQANLQQTKTPPCTPKKTKTEEPEAESYPEPKSKNWEYNNSSGVSNYFIDASSLLDEDEIISPPISLINFKSLQGAEEPETKTDAEREAPQTSKKVVSNFFATDSNDDSVSYMKEQERRQGEIIFRNSIPHFSKHDVEGNQVQDNTERLRGGADPYTADVVEDDNEQVVPSADLNEFSSNRDAFERDPPGSVESHFFESVPPSDYAWESEEVEDHTDGIIDGNVESQPIPSSRESTKDLSSSSVCSGSPNLRRRNEAAPILSGGLELMEEEKKVQRKGSQSQGEAWIVTFDDNKKARNRFASSDTGSEPESGRENSEDRRTPSLSRSYRQSRKNEPSVEFYVREQNNTRAAQGDSNPEPKMNPVEKSSSFGYFLDFGKESAEQETAEEKSEQPPEKRNIFSMFIGMGDDSKPKKPKPVLEKEQTFDKSSEENQNEPAECSEDVKKSFYMFIGSDSPNVKRKQTTKKPETSARKTYLRTQSYTVEGHLNDHPKAGSKTDVECSSSDNSLPYVAEAEGKAGRSLRGKFRGEPKITAWCETKVPNESDVSSESWLRTKDIQVNYKGGRGEEYKNGVYLKKDSTFIMGNEYKGKHEKYTRISLKDLEETKPPKRDSGVISDESFVKLSDLDTSEITRPKDRMSQSTTESGSRKSAAAEETPLSKSIGCEGGKVGSAGSGLYDRKVNQSLSRLFPNLSAQSLASISRKDGETSETSEVSSSLQSSAEPTGLEISTSETDVSTHVGTTSSKLGEDLLKMFLEEISPDVVVEVSGRRIKAHKCILSSRCQYFAAMLSGGWVESAGNVISLQGFSYNAVHFALRHIYSGESRIPESLNIVELATLADMLCLDGLQEIISYNLKVKYCHSFHVPCSVCSVGVIDCLPIAAAYGLEDLYRKCLRWITKYFVKLWPTKSFGSLSKELLEKCYLHQVVHLTVDNVLDTIVNIDKVRGSLPNVRWAEPVSHLVNKLHNASVKYVAEHFSSVLTSDNFLALGKEAGWNVSRLEDSLIETIRYLPPEQACWSHARLHRILSVASGPDPPSEMDWNENFLKLLQLIAELVENSLIKQAPRAAKSKAWRQMEPELRSRIQEAACLVLPDPEPSPSYRRSNYVKREGHQPNIPQTAKSRTLELRQIKLAMSQQANRPNTSRPLSLQIDQRPKKDSRFVPLRQSVSTSSVRKPEPTEGIRKTQSRSQILGSTYSEPKKTINPRYSEVKSRYLEPRSPQKIAIDKATSDTTQRRAFRYISSSDSSRNCSPALRPSNSRSSIPQAKKSTVGTTRQPSVFKSESTSTLDAKRDRSFASTKSDTTSAKTLSRLAGDENMSTDSLCTDSLLSDKEATLKRRPGKENLGEGRRKPGNPATVVKSSTNSPIARRHDAWSSAPARTPAAKKLILSKPPSSEGKTNPPRRFPATAAKIPAGGQHKVNSTSGRTTAGRNQRNSGKTDQNLVNGNSNRRRSEVDSENNKKNSKEPTAVSRSGTFLKDEPTILKKPRPESEVQG